MISQVTSDILRKTLLPLNGYENPGSSPSFSDTVVIVGREVNEGFVIEVQADLCLSLPYVVLKLLESLEVDD